VWLNYAMATDFAPLSEIEPDEFRRATEVTYLGSVWGTMAALRRMRTRDSGVVVQVGSALTYRGIPLESAYCGAKHALQGFLESVRSSCGPRNTAAFSGPRGLPSSQPPQSPL
jgi:NAD(P)-dependent dehydrogenase (short-subunit alcohol dehydrogenase family)